MRVNDKFYIPARRANRYSKINKMLIEELQYCYDSKGHIRMYKSKSMLEKYTPEDFDAIITFSQSQIEFVRK